MPNKSEGGWSGIGTANSGIDPTHVYFLNDRPTQIPPSDILRPVVQNCRSEDRMSKNLIQDEVFGLMRKKLMVDQVSIRTRRE